MNSLLYGSISARDLRSDAFRRFLIEHVRDGAVALGPAYALSRPGDYFVSPLTDGSHFTVRSRDGCLRRFLNVCPHYHRQLHAPKDDWSSGYMGSYRNGVHQCGGHLWGSDTSGKHLAPIALRVGSGDQCTNLIPSMENGACIDDIGGVIWFGTPKQLLAPRRLLELPLAKDVGLTHYVKSDFRLKRIWVDLSRFSSFMGMVIFEDMNHPDKGVHAKKLGHTAGMRAQRRGYDAQYGVSLQVVPWVTDADPSKMSEWWRRYYTLIKTASEMGIVDPSGGTIAWGADYNNFFTNEHYPYMIVNSWFLPTEDGGARNVVEFYFPEEVLAKLGELAEAAMAAYMGGEYEHAGTMVYEEGIAQEDALLALHCDRGMDILVQAGQGDRVIGPLDPITDAAVHAFHAYVGAKWDAFRSR